MVQRVTTWALERGATRAPSTTDSPAFSPCLSRRLSRSVARRWSASRQPNRRTRGRRCQKPPNKSFGASQSSTSLPCFWLGWSCPTMIHDCWALRGPISPHRPSWSPSTMLASKFYPPFSMLWFWCRYCPWETLLFTVRHSSDRHDSSTLEKFVHILTWFKKSAISKFTLNQNCKNSKLNFFKSKSTLQSCFTLDCEWQLFFKPLRVAAVAVVRPCVLSALSRANSWLPTQICDIFKRIFLPCFIFFCTSRKNSPFVVFYCKFLLDCHLWWSKNSPEKCPKKWKRAKFPVKAKREICSITIRNDTGLSRERVFKLISRNS